MLCGLTLNSFTKQSILFQSLVLKKLGQPVMTNLYYNTVKMLLERISSVMVDHQALKVMILFAPLLILDSTAQSFLCDNLCNTSYSGDISSQFVFII